MVILKEQRVEDVDKFFKEAKSLSVALPAELKQRLEALKTSFEDKHDEDERAD